MNSDVGSLVMKYAQAYFNVAQTQLDEQETRCLDEVRYFLIANKKIVFFLGIAVLNKEVLRSALERLFATCKTKAILIQLSFLLIEQRRVFLLADILFYSQELYREKIKQVLCTVTSSASLSMQQQKILEQFVQKQTGASSVICTYKLNPALIAGVRIENETMVWEHSIAKQLARSRQALKTEEYDGIKEH
jgi:ATP synthase F1 delta subunit